MYKTGMEIRIGDTRLFLLQGDITREKADAIVNAANSSLMGGGGVDGAIHRAGGPAILEECRKIILKIGKLKNGDAVATGGGLLPAKWVIHTVGPVWQDGMKGEPELLTSCYTNSLKRGAELGVETICFPSISTGAYGYPFEKAVPVALEAIRSFLIIEKHTLKEVRLVYFTAGDIKQAEGLIHE